MANVPCGATYDVTTNKWSYTGTQNQGGNCYAADGSTTFEFTVAATPTNNTISLAPSGTGTGQLLNFPDGVPTFIQNVTRTGDTTFSFEDTDPAGTFGSRYEFQIGVSVNGGSVQYSPDPIIINKDPDC
jgi:hypothetical protein